MATFFKPTKTQSLLGSIIKLTIERIDHNGCGVAYYKKKAVFVEQTLLAEQVTAKVIEQTSKFIKAKLLSVESNSEYRVKPICRHFSTCGGCDLQHIDPSQHMAFKQDKIVQLFKRQGIEQALPWQPAIIKSPLNYRRKARIGVQYDKKGQALIGFRQKGSNQLTAIKQCPVLVPGLANIFSQLKSIIDALTAHKCIGHIEVIATQHVTLVVRQLVKLTSHDQKIWQQAAQKYQWSVYFDDGKSRQALAESEPLQYSLNSNVAIEFCVDDFIQVNHDVNVAMVEQALLWLELNSDDQVLDLFCGLGNFSLPIAKKVAHVYGVEGVQTMVDKALENAKLNGIDNCHFYQADLNSSWQSLSWLTASNVNKVLLDPARAGAETAVVEVAKLAVEKIVYVSCEPSSLARDTKQLLALGYRVEKISMIEMFSHTKHVETMVLFKRTNLAW
jgi:23S rRNA (uracil1939-C5)-methyltransferase